MTSTATPANPMIVTLPDVRGSVWQFAYWGSGYVYIREMFDDEDRVIPVGDRATRDDWPFLIDLNDYGMRPDDVTTAWVSVRAHHWIHDRNSDLAAGNL